MSKKAPVMSHDPLAGMPGDAEANNEPAGTVAEEPQAAAAADEDAVGPFALPENLTIADVDGVRSALLPLLTAGSALQIAANDVENVDCAGVQLLASFAQSAHDANVSLSWVEPSSGLKQAAADLGLSAVVGLETVIAEGET